MKQIKNTTHTVAVGLLSVFALALACMGKSEEPADEAAETAAAPEANEAERPAKKSKDFGAEPELKAKSDRAKPNASEDRASDMAPMAQAVEADQNEPGGGYGGKTDKDGEATGVRSRAWFPETFLFDPLVVTDDQGRGQVSVTVPDRLTTWRVLALAHSRNGSQAGATAEFLGTLPAYVDPVLPPRLRVGDKVRIPVQIVNTTDKDLRSDLIMSADGADLQAPPRAVTVAARGRTIVMATIAANVPGTMRLTATLGGTDAVVRTAEVIPTGRRIDIVRKGTLAAPRKLKISGPTGGSDRARLDVFPGALAIVRSELASAGGRGGLGQNAFTLLLAGQAPKLLAKFGDSLDDDGADKLRTMTILATQRTVRLARTLNEDSATLLARAALAHPDNALLVGIGERALAYLQTNQLPDGSCGGQNGWTLQRLLVATADCARAAKDTPIVVARASGLFERNAAQISDPYTAAAVLVAFSSANRTPDLAMVTKLRKLVQSALSDSVDGSRYLVVPDGVVRADGQRPGLTEASALAALALKSDPDSAAMVADLGATVLSGYSRSRGFGDGRASLVAMEALVSLFETALPKKVEISLLRNGEVVAKGALDSEKIRDVLELRVPNTEVAGEHQWEVRAEPALAGLGYALELSTWAPWPAQKRDGGLEISAPPPKKLFVGVASPWTIEVAAPAGSPFEVSLEVPAGTTIERGVLEALVADAAIRSFELNDYELKLLVAPLAPGKTFAATISVIPTVAGTLSSGPSMIQFDGQSVTEPPALWDVAALKR